MAEFPSLPLYTDAYIADTQHLTNEEHGAYLRLLMFAWRSPDCALPNDDKRLAIMVGMTPKKWASVRDTIMGFWTLNEIGWQQDRLTFERRRVSDLLTQKSNAGKASARAKSRKNKEPSSTSVATGDPTGGQQPDPVPNPSNTTLYSGAGELDQFEGRLRQAARLEQSPSPSLMELSAPLNWLRSGCDLEMDIFPTLKARTHDRVSSWSYFTNAVFEARDKRLQPSPDVRKFEVIEGKARSAPSKTEQILHELAEVAHERDNRTG